MKAGLFTAFLKDPASLDPAASAELKDLIREFPFCQPAQILYARSLRNEDDIRFGKQLRLASLYAGDRRLLHRLLSPADLPAVNPAPSPVTHPGNTELVDLAHEVGQLLPIEEDDLLPFDFRVLGEERQEEPQFVESGPLPKEEDGIFILDEEWSGSKPKPGDDLIDKFIRNTGSLIVRPDPDAVSDRDVSALSHREDDEFLTETLARIYVKQGYYLKAIQAYEKLSLKIPEKSIYFASQIEMVRELIKNQ